MKSFFSDIPFSSRQAYYYDMQAAVCNGLADGVVLNFLFYVAKKSLLCSQTQLALFFRIPALGLIAAVLIPWLFGVCSKRKLIIASSLVSRLPLFLIPFVGSPLGFILPGSIALGGMFVLVPAYHGLLKVNYPEEMRASIFSRIQFRHFGCSVVTALLAGKFLDVFPRGWFVLFPLAGIFGLAGMYLLGKIRIHDERFSSRSRRPLMPLKKLLEVLRNDRSFVAYELILMIGGIANFVGIQLFITYAVEVLGVDFAHISFISHEGILVQGMALLSLGFWGRFMDRFRTPMLSRAIINLFWIAHPLSYYLAKDVWMLYLGVIILGFVRGGGKMNFQLCALYFAPRDQTPVYSGAHSLFNALRLILSSYIAILFARAFSMRLSFLILIGMLLLSSALNFGFYFLSKKRSCR